MYINIHTHHAALARENCFQVMNFYSQFELAASGSYCTLGLHPWFLENYDLNLDILKKYAHLPNVLGIGECGLDKDCLTDFETQKSVFKQQILLAKVLNKPLILHCVKSYDEVLRMLNEIKFKQIVIFHGFNKKATLAKQLVQQGFHLSFGASLLTNPIKMKQVLNSIPLKAIFLETDDAKIDIEAIYLQAALLLNISLQDLILHIQNNFEKAFKINLQE